MTLRERIKARLLNLECWRGWPIAEHATVDELAAEVERLMRLAWREGQQRVVVVSCDRDGELHRLDFGSFRDDIEIEPGGSPTTPAHLLPNPPGCSHRECRYPECSCERPGCEEEKP